MNYTQFDKWVKIEKAVRNLLSKWNSDNIKKNETHHLTAVRDDKLGTRLF